MSERDERRTDSTGEKILTELPKGAVCFGDLQKSIYQYLQDHNPKQSSESALKRRASGISKALRNGIRINFGQTFFDDRLYFGPNSRKIDIFMPDYVVDTIRNCYDETQLAYAVKEMQTNGQIQLSVTEAERVTSSNPRRIWPGLLRGNFPVLKAALEDVVSQQKK